LDEQVSLKNFIRVIVMLFVLVFFAFLTSFWGAFYFNNTSNILT